MWLSLEVCSSYRVGCVWGRSTVIIGLRMGSGKRCLEFHNLRLGPDYQGLFQKHWDLSSK